MDFFAIGLGMYGLYKISNENIEGVIPYMALIVSLFIFTFMMVKKRGEELWIDLLVIGMCIFRKNCASVPEERSAIPLQTEQSSAG